MNDVEKAERQLALAKLAEEYDEIQLRVQGGSATDEERVRYRELAGEVAQTRSELRAVREAETAAEGDGVASPEAVTGSSGVG